MELSVSCATLCSEGRLSAAVLLLLDFLPFYGAAFEMLYEIKCKQD